MNTFSCPCGGKFKATSEILYYFYPPKYLFKCNCCGNTKALSEAVAFGNSCLKDEDSPLLKKLKEYGTIEVLETTL